MPERYIHFLLEGLQCLSAILKEICCNDTTVRLFISALTDDGDGFPFFGSFRWHRGMTDMTRLVTPGTKEDETTVKLDEYLAPAAMIPLQQNSTGRIQGHLVRSSAVSKFFHPCRACYGERTNVRSSRLITCSSANLQQVSIS